MGGGGDWGAGGGVCGAGGGVTVLEWPAQSQTLTLAG